jgi:hypothetical protein
MRAMKNFFLYFNAMLVLRNFRLRLILFAL